MKPPSGMVVGAGPSCQLEALLGTKARLSPPLFRHSSQAPFFPSLFRTAIVPQDSTGSTLTTEAVFPPGGYGAAGEKNAS
jgi:hypothetical protein